ncbi:trypsin-1-like [Penaeus indicus]|uniref:trypsin-1-like n=1 Tax=Penaeus indicus TaxID=29960 RepID=UPI00300CBD4D
MKSLAVVVLVFGAATVAAKAGGKFVPEVVKFLERAPQLPPHRIVGGDVATQGQFPAMVSLQHRSLFGSSHTCGGTIINDNHVLTAAHCVKGYSDTSFDIVAGEQNLDHTSGLEEVKRSQKVFMHDFSTTTGVNDIAIIRTSHNFVFVHDLVSTVALPSDYQEASNGTICTAVGWGYTAEGGDVSSDLRYVDLPYLTDDECRDIYGEDAVMIDMMCAGFLGGQGVCNGDSGGPLFCDGVQQGIVSWGSGCDAFPAVYTQVSHFLDWIKINMEA